MIIETLPMDRILQLSPADQELALEEIGFDFMGDVDDYLCRIIEVEELEDPDPDIVSRFFERTLDEPDERIAVYRQSGELAASEREAFREFLREDAAEDEYRPGLFSGEITDGTRIFCVIARRTGGGWDCEAEFVEVFESSSNALEKLRKNGAELI